MLTRISQLRLQLTSRWSTHQNSKIFEHLLLFHENDARLFVCMQQVIYFWNGISCMLNYLLYDYAVRSKFDS